MPQFTSLIVGAHFRPPAKQVLAVLPQGAGLRLEEENDNPYDASAVKVFADLDQIPESQLAGLEVELPNAGLTLEQLMSTGPVFLGYVPASEGKPLAKARAAGEPDLIGNQQVRELMPCSPTLGFATDGSPRLQITSPPSPAAD